MLQVGVIVVFAALAICFWVLQVVQHENYVEMADSNYQRTLALRAPRGVLFDRNGKVLVENRNSYTISIIRENTKDLDRTVRTLVGRRSASIRRRSSRSSTATVASRATGRSSSSRTPRSSRWPPSWRGGDSSCRRSSSSRCRRANIPPTRSPRICSAMSAKPTRRQVEDGMSRGAIVGKYGVEQIYNELLMGDDGARPSSSTAWGARSGDARRDAAESKAAASS